MSSITDTIITPTVTPSSTPEEINAACRLALEEPFRSILMHQHYKDELRRAIMTVDENDALQPGMEWLIRRRHAAIIELGFFFRKYGGKEAARQQRREQERAEEARLRALQIAQQTEAEQQSTYFRVVAILEDPDIMWAIEKVFGEEEGPQLLKQLQSPKATRIHSALGTINQRSGLIRYLARVRADLATEMGNTINFRYWESRSVRRCLEELWPKAGAMLGLLPYYQEQAREYFADKCEEASNAILDAWYDSDELANAIEDARMLVNKIITDSQRPKGASNSASRRAKRIEREQNQEAARQQQTVSRRQNTKAERAARDRALTQQNKDRAAASKNSGTVGGKHYDSGSKNKKK